MEDSINNGGPTRRDFLETGIAVIAGAAIGAAVGKVQPILEQNEGRETVKMLTADGKLVEVEKRHLPPMCGTTGRVSNQVLQDWMKEGKS